ncbi:MAG TPA: hypothetical protein VFB66_31310 [Tepidisphaeraceae bacterium]|nr:hypothetical protein [Tepidisphaeraceae bacterium]
MAASLARLGVELEIHLDEVGDSGHVSCGSNLAAVAYTPNGGPNFDEVVKALQRVVPAAHRVPRLSPLRGLRRLVVRLSPAGLRRW